ncbi:MAG: RNA polymerase sigma-70 factor [Cytophagales bacterium]|nr:RNA polymerase sigma-70 factor [Cytophagales bacterium]
MPQKQLSYEREQLLYLKKGEKAVFEEIFNQHYTIFTRFAITIVHQGEIAEEIVQDVFVNLWEKRENLSIETNLKAYLFTAVRNASLNYLNSKEGKNQQVTTFSLEENLLIDEDSQNQLEFLELQHFINLSIRKLPPRSQEVFKLSRFEGLSYAEIASKLGVTVKAVEKQMSQSLKRMRDFLSLRGK